MFGHALRNSLLPIVTLLGLELPQLIGGSVIVEAMFGVRGMGLVALEAIRMPDYPLVITHRHVSRAAHDARLAVRGSGVRVARSAHRLTKGLTRE